MGGYDLDEYEHYQDEYEEDGVGEYEEEKEEEEHRLPTQEESEYLELRQNLKESIRKKMKKDSGSSLANSQEKRQQDEELDELGTSVEKIGSVGLTIHDELLSEEKIMEELGSEMDSTANRLDFVQVEKSGHGYEEGYCQGSDDDDLILDHPLHHLIRFGFLHLTSSWC
ncbi:hypothetical protein L2E82_51973 [Cichorium intybus]|nr:hypothetical protein L2E82_51973 [Cichorium intybus]